MTSSPRAALLAALFASATWVACETSPKTTLQTPAQVLPSELAGAPEWVSGNCADYWDDDGQHICGVGSVGGTRNIGLARTAAIARGRTEIARSLEVSVAAMLKDYQASTTGGASFGQAATDDQFIEDTTKQITDRTIKGTELAASWISDSGTFYALVSLNLEKFADAVNQMDALSEGVRTAVVERAREAFVELERETGTPEQEAATW